jgi:hypothetical protein
VATKLRLRALIDGHNLRRPPLDARVLARLRAAFAGDTEMLRQQLDADLSSWR